MKIILLFLTFIGITFQQTETENNCIMKNNRLLDSKLIPSDCNLISKDCCHVKIQYKHPDLGDVNNEYCAVIYSTIDNFKNKMINSLFDDINRFVRKTQRDFDRYTWIGQNNDPLWYQNKKIWCPFNCKTPNITTLNCEPEKEIKVDIIANELELKLKEFYSKPTYTNAEGCVDFDIASNTCLSFSLLQDNSFDVMIDSLNYQYGYTRCINPSSPNVCSQDVLDTIELDKKLYIGNKVKPSRSVTPTTCIEYPRDLISIDVQCPTEFVGESKILQYSSLLLLLLFML